MSKLNKRAVAIFSICLILFITIIPFAASAITYYPIEFTFSLPSSSYLDRATNNVSGTIYFYDHNTDTSYTYTYNSIIYSSRYISGNSSYVTALFYQGINGTGNTYINLQITIRDNGNLRYSENYIYVNGIRYSASMTLSNNVYYLHNDRFDIKCTRPIDSQSYYYLSFVNQVGYTLTFNSEGGSSIAPVTGITSLQLGDSTGYYPEYTPERAGYSFLGWSLTPGGTYVRQVELTEDTILYANWERYSGIIMIDYAYHQIPLYRTPDLAITAPGIVENYTFLDFYYTDTASLPHWYNEWIITDTNTGGQNYKKIVQAEHIDNLYKFYVQTYDFDITIAPYIYPTYTLTVNISENMDQYVSLDDGDTFTYDTHDGLTLNYDTYWPYWDVYLMLYDLDDHEDYYYGSGVFSNWGDLNTNDPYNVYYSYEFFTDFGADTNLNITMFRSDIEIDPTTDIVSYEVNPLTSEVTVVWTVSQTDLLDISWDELRSEMPAALNGILGGFYGLPMLSSIVIFCFIAGFAVWFVRRGD